MSFEERFNQAGKLLDEELLDGLDATEIAELSSFLINRDELFASNEVLNELAAPYENVDLINFKVLNRFSDLFPFTSGGCNKIYTAFDTETLKNIIVRIPGEYTTPLDRLMSYERYYQEYNLLRKLNELGIKGTPKEIMIGSTNIDNNDELEVAYLVIEAIEGRDLSQVIDVEDIDITEMKQIFIKICEIMKNVHDNDIVHRDLKPQNIMIDNDNEVVIIDWESALDKEAMSGSYLDPGNVVTLGYSPPERVNKTSGASVFSKSEDIYSLGATLLRMLTKEHMFEVLQSDDIRETHKNYEIPTLLQNIRDHISDEKLIKVIEKAMHPNSEERYSDIEELLSDFRYSL